MSLVTLLTDFGTADGYVGAMKGVLCTLAPGVIVLDLSHDVPRGDITAGAWALRRATRTFAEGTIHVAVIDPGVGTARRAMLLEAAGRLYIGPDNGLLSLVEGAEQARGWWLNRQQLFRPAVSRTFHGRDVFASIAGHLAAGRVAPDDCGAPICDWLRLERTRAHVSQHRVSGVIIQIDRFGNLITNIEAASLEDVASWSVRVGDHPLGHIRQTYADVERGEWVVYVGSEGTLEIALREGSAADCSGAGIGHEVTLCR